MTGSWKTTLFGCLAAAMIAVAPLIQTGTIDWKAVVIAALVAAFSFVAKDKNVTGGTTDNGERPK